MVVLLIILKVILYIILAVLAIILAVIALPFTYSAEVLVAEGVDARYNFGWPGRLVQIKGEYREEMLNMGIFIGGRRILRLNGKHKLRTKKIEAEKKEEKEEAKEKSKSRFSVKEFIDKSFIDEILEYVKTIFRLTKPRYLKLSGTYGFEDPALTGMTYGLICVIRGCIPQAKLDFYPCFTDAVLELDLKTEGELVAAPIIYQTIRMVLKKPVRGKIFRKRK